MKRRVYVSVYDKVGLVDFAKNLVEKFDYEIIAGGDSYAFLKQAGIEAINVSDFCENPLFSSAGISSLNADVFAGILSNSRDTSNLTEAERDAIKPFDMVVVNVCPFERIVLESDNIDEIISQVDIFGLSLLRAGAKNYRNVTVITDKIDYYVALNANEFGRLKLAVKAFNTSANYDRAVSQLLAEHTGDKPFKAFNFEKIKDLEFGENPHQKAAIYKNERMIDYEVLFDKELSFNDIINVTEVMNIIAEFYDVNAAAVVRHTKPCGVALGRSLYDAYTKAFDCDPISCFNGTYGFSQPLDYEIAKHINSMSVEVIVAPGFDEKSLELFAENPEIKLVKLNTSLAEYRKLTSEEIMITPFGTLVQDSNNSELKKETFQVVTQIKPTPEQIEDAVFAWNVVKHAKTNAAVIAKDFKTYAISQGNTNSLQAVEAALNYACDGSKEAVLASDDTIPAEDCIYAAAQGRISVIIQPGGSIKEQKLIEVCNKYGVAMITTGIKNYRQ